MGLREEDATVAGPLGRFKQWALLQPSGPRAGEQGKVPLTQVPALGLTGDPSGWHCARVQEGPASRRQCREAGLTAVPATRYVLRTKKGW